MLRAAHEYDVAKLPPLFTKVIYTEDSEYDDRAGADVVAVGYHHAVTTSLLAIIDLSAPGGREVSMNFAVKDNQRILRVPLWARAYTSASRYDFGSWTIEAANETMAPDYLLSDATYTSLAIIAAHAYVRESVPLTVGYPGLYQHKNLYEWFNASYPTACAGPHFDTWRVVREAEAILEAALKEDDMKCTDLSTSVDYPDQEVKAGQTVNLWVNAEKFVTVATGPAQGVQGNLHLSVAGGKPFASTFRVTPVVRTVVKGKETARVSLGGLEVIFTPGETTTKVPVNLAMGENQRLSFEIGGSTEDLTVKSGIFRGQKFTEN